MKNNTLKNHLHDALNILFFCIFSLIIPLFCGIIAYFLYFSPLAILIPNLYQKKKVAIWSATDGNGKYLCKKSDKESLHHTIHSISPHLVNAFLSAEDATFFQHRGISFSAIFRSILVNIKKGFFAQGGSTITQQLIKLLYKNFKKTIMRKLRDQCVAFILETRISKERIFERYINELYFGNGIHGIDMAASFFFNKKPDLLTAAESATIAGIIKSPTKYNPINNEKKSLERRNIILGCMKKNNFLDEESYFQAITEQLQLSPGIYQQSAHYIISINKFLERINNNYQKSKNLYIQTTFIPSIQQIAEKIFLEKIDYLQKKCKKVNGAVIILNNKNGAIEGIIHGKLARNNDIERAFRKQHQIGSIIKPLCVIFALLQGDTEETSYMDEPIKIDEWNPQNNNKKFEGKISLKNALIQSNNIVFIKMLQKYGLTNFVDFINKTDLFHIKDAFLSIALGCIEKSPLSIAKYLLFLANKGNKKNPHFIRLITDENGGILYRNKQKEKKLQTIPDEIFDKLDFILKEIGEKLLKKNNIVTNKKIAAKTGTGDKGRGFWCIAYHEAYSVVTFIGSDDNEPLYKYGIRSGTDAAWVSLKILSKI